MTAEAAILDETHDDGSRDGRARRCIVTGEVLPEAMLVRFVEGPEAEVVPDIAAKLPGRGMWVRADRAALEKAAAKNPFSRSARKPLKVPADLADRVEALLVRRMGSDLGLARRAGQLILGFDQIVRAFGDKSPPRLLVEASDGAADGRRKLLAAARASGLEIQVLDRLDSAELGLALGRENVVHAALKSGQLAERLKVDAGRLAGLRTAGGNSGPVSGPGKNRAGPIPAAKAHPKGRLKGSNERDE